MMRGEKFAKIMAWAVFTALIGLCLFSYHSEDFNYLKTGNFSKIKNLAGAFGVVVSHLLYFLFGKLSVVVPLLLILIPFRIAKSWSDLKIVKEQGKVFGFYLWFLCFVAWFYPKPKAVGVVGVVISGLGKSLMGEIGFLFLFTAVLTFMLIYEFRFIFENPPLFEKKKLSSSVEPVKVERKSVKKTVNKKVEKTEKKEKISFPSPSLLLPPPPPPPLSEEIKRTTRLLEQTFKNFGVEAKVVNVETGPVLTRYEVQPAPGVKVSKIASLADDITLALSALRVRIIAPIPGKGVVGIEVPNKNRQLVRVREIIESEKFSDSNLILPVALGKDVLGTAIVEDVVNMPHLLIAGVTGSGKSVCLHSILISLLFRHSPETLRLLLIDPKRVELSHYDGIPHLITPVVTDARKATATLKWLVEEMENRYHTLAKAGKRTIEDYNKTGGEKMPYIVAIIDELADLMMVASSEVESHVARLAQMARAVGIHLILATQRPSVDVITGTIKANFPSRIAFQVFTKVDSRVILDMTGAEALLGKGDMLYLPAGAPKPIRMQGAFVTTEEIKRVAEHWKQFGQPEYMFVDIEQPAEEKAEWMPDEDPLFEQAVRIVLETGQASISHIQRKMKVGYARAARLIDMMERKGIIGGYQGSGKTRKILVGWDYLEKLKKGGTG